MTLKSLSLCPYCGAEVLNNFYHLYVTLEDSELKTIRRCYSCDRTWTEYWELIKIEVNDENI